MCRWLRNGSIDPPEIPNVHHAIAGIGEKICIEVSYKGICEQTKQNEI
jgi:hypothetical protein